MVQETFAQPVKVVERVTNRIHDAFDNLSEMFGTQEEVPEPSVWEIIDIKADAEDVEVINLDEFQSEKPSKPWVNPDTVGDEIACVDIHGMLKNDAVLKGSTEKLFMFMIEKGLDKNQALAIVGNSLIDAHNNPYLEPQKVVLPIAGAAALQGLRACAINPACAKVISSGLFATGVALKMTIDGTAGSKTQFMPTEKIGEDLEIFPAHEEEGPKILTTPIPEHDKEANLERFPVHEEDGLKIFVTPEHKSEVQLESFPISDDTGPMIFPKIKFDEKGNIDVEKSNLKDSEGGSHRGHSVERHVGKDKEYLKNRNIPVATTFPDYETANEAYKEVLKQNHDEIIKWAKDEKQTLPKGFEAKLKDNVGFGYTKYGVEFKTDKVTSVFVKVDGKIKVKTTYPIK